ncbi:MAG: hypothetical protein ACI9MC_004072 [Kiritimatiellia bacterium]|jgi:hypothetical protein
MDCAIRSVHAKHVLASVVMRTAFLYLSALVLPTLAFGSSETDLPPALRADVSVRYEAQALWGGLNEDSADGSVEVGRRRDVRHEVLWTATFAPVDGLALVIRADQVPHYSVGFPTSRTMGQDPVTQEGSSQAGAAVDELVQTKGSGMEGVWFGLAFAPYANRYDKQHAVDWRLDLAWRTPSNRSFWEPDEEGRRGVAIGGTTWKATGAFSRHHRSSSPYMVVDWQFQARRNATVPDGLGGDVIVGVAPGHNLNARGGIEVLVSKGRLPEPEVNLDLGVGFGYVSPARVPSGVLLPSVLPSSQQGAVVRPEYLMWHGHFGVDFEMHELAAVRIWSRVSGHMPHRLERVYPVYAAADTLQAGFGLELVGRYR